MKPILKIDKNSIIVSLFIFIITSIPLNSQIQDISIKIVYLNSSKIFIYPDSPDLLLRKKNIPIDDIWGLGVEYRKNFKDYKFNLGLNLEYLQKVIKNSTFKSDDGFWTIPIELTGYFYLPLGIEKWNIFMGAGLGAYIGGRNLKQDQKPTYNKNQKPGFGIHVIGGLDYFLLKEFGLRFELKFRDLYFNTTNKFENGDIYPDEFQSKVNADGMILSLGIVYNF